MSISRDILEAAKENDYFFKESSRSYILICPSCGKSKLYFDKNHYNYICFAGGCGNKGLAHKLLSQIKRIPLKEAYELLHHKKEQHTDWKLNIDLDKEDIQVVESDNLPAAMQDHFFQLNVKESLDGMEYLSSRGLTGSLCLKHKLMYSPLWRRVIFPIFIDNDLMGYQARAIDPVDKSDRMRNNPGFRKGGFVMFLDEAKNSDHLIIAEGPVDALKFSNVGGYVATLGKDLSLTQIEMINNHPAKKIYWALDSDALNLVEGYARMVDKESYLVLPTEDSEKRITLAGKKVDFGECTFDECEQAFKEARNINDSLLLGGLK